MWPCVQGQLNDSWLVSAISCAAVFPKIIRRVFKDQEEIENVMEVRSGSVGLRSLVTLFSNFGPLIFIHCVHCGSESRSSISQTE